MEFALAIQSIDQITCLEQPWKKSDHSLIEQETLGNVETVLQSFYESPSFTRLYFGSEYCQYRLPKAKDLVEAYAKAVKAGFAFTFVTPYVTQAGMVQLRQLLAELHDEAIKSDDTIEIVVNDWGVLYEVKQYTHFQPVVGRLLNKMIRDPRVAHLYDREDAPQKANAVLQTPAVSVSYFKRFLQTSHVKRIEFDNLIQNMGSPLGEEEFSSSLHIGFGVIASGRSCLVGTLHKPKEEKFKGEVKCKQQCRHYQVELVSKKERLGALPTRNMQKGNSVFYQQTQELLKKGIQWAIEKNVNRIVVSPKIPV